MSLTKTQIENMKNISCEKCQCQLMTQLTLVKHISGLLMQDGKDAYIPVPVLACKDCGHVNEVFAKELGIINK
jgi:uncharacterized Zn finger protein